MGKAKRKKVSDKVRSKKHSAEKKVNPFEVRVNKQKHDVLGKKLAKYDKGMPGISRSRAIKKRKETLLVEYKKRGKANTLLDRRFGENDPTMSVEDKMLQRFALERQKFHEKSQLFSLADDEAEDEGGLTHLGQSLSEVEKFEDPKDESSEDEEDEDRGKIGAKMVAEEHFGGGTLKKADEDSGKHKSWKERMEEIIAKSKKAKYERQHEKEETVKLTEKLDDEWKELAGKAWFASKKAGKENGQKKEVDEYDKMVRELQFEMKGKPSDRLKTEEELAKEEKERLDNLESERQRRMNGMLDDGKAGAGTHRSADDLDDGFEFDLVPAVPFEAQYKEGKLIGAGQEEAGSDASGDEDSDEEEGGSEEEEDGSDEDEEDSSEEEEEEDGMGAGSDLDSSDNDSEEEEEDTASAAAKLDTKQRSKQEINKEEKESSKDQDTKSKKKEQVMEAALKELPYTFPAPQTYEDLLELLEGHNEREQLVIIERIRKCHHPSLAEGNKAKLESLFVLLVQFYADLAVQTPPLTGLMDRLVRHLYQLCQMSPRPAAAAMLQVITERHEEFSQTAQHRARFPSLDTLLLLKLVSILFPTSDFRHPVVTPSLMFMSEVLTTCPVTSLIDATNGLFICNLFLEYVAESKRVVPEVLNFLQGILFLATSKKPNVIEPVIPPFKPVGKHISLLELGEEENCQDVKLQPVSLSRTDMQKPHERKTCLLWQCLSLAVRFSSLYKAVPSYVQLFLPLKHFWSRIPTEKYPEEIQDLITELDTKLSEEQQKAKKWIAMPKPKPHAIKLYEPKIEEDFDPTRKKKNQDKQKNEKQKLAAKYKKEMKGALREVRKDAHFLASQKLREQMEKDSERKRKVKEIYGQLASQEGDYQAIKRNKTKD